MTRYIDVGVARDISDTGYNNVALAISDPTYQEVARFRRGYNGWYSTFSNINVPNQNVNLTHQVTYYNGGVDNDLYPKLTSVNIPELQPRKTYIKYGWGNSNGTGWVDYILEKNTTRVWPIINRPGHIYTEEVRHTLKGFTNNGANYTRTTHIYGSGTITTDDLSEAYNWINTHEGGGDSYAIYNIYGNVIVDINNSNYGDVFGFIRSSSDDLVVIVNIFGNVGVTSVGGVYQDKGYFLRRHGRAYSCINIMDGGSLSIYDPRCAVFNRKNDYINVFGNGVLNAPKIWG